MYCSELRYYTIKNQTVRFGNNIVYVHLSRVHRKNVAFVEPKYSLGKEKCPLIKVRRHQTL